MVLILVTCFFHLDPFDEISEKEDREFSGDEHRDETAAATVLEGEEKLYNRLQTKKVEARLN